jgi:RimJ/RimL family protein N-acetyltransferase
MRAARLNDGHQVWIRPIGPGDAWRLQDALRHLSQQTIQRRFLSSKHRFTAAELQYLTELDGVNHVALVAISGSTGRLMGVARFVRDAEQPDTAEWAITIGDPWQRQGLGTLLARDLVDEARKVGITRFSASIAGENRAVGHLLAHITDHFERDVYDHGVREVVVTLAA